MVSRFRSKAATCARHSEEKRAISFNSTGSGCFELMFHSALPKPRQEEEVKDLHEQVWPCSPFRKDSPLTDTFGEALNHQLPTS